MRMLCACLILLAATAGGRADGLGNILGPIAKKHAGKVAIAVKHLPSGETIF